MTRRARRPVGRPRKPMCPRGCGRKEETVLRDCGQRGVCRTPPGCMRHWEERNRELVRENEVLRSNSDHLSSENASMARQVESMAMRIESLAEELAKPEDGRAVIFKSMHDLDDFKTRATRVINVVFGGEHHTTSVKWSGPDATPTGCKINVHQGGMATYDYNYLTRLVVACHDECVRAAITNGGPCRLTVRLSNRTRRSRHPDMCAHPTLEQHVEAIRRGGSLQKLFDELRDE